MAASKILVWEDPRRIDKAGHLMYPDGQNRGRGSGQLDHGQFDRIEETLWPDGCAAMYRRAMLDEIGGFDEEFFAYADDAELGLRGRIAGWTCLYAPGAVVRHHRGATLGLGSARRLTLIERNRVLLVVKLFPWNLLWANGAYYLARMAAGLWAALRNGGNCAAIQGPAGKLSAATALLRGYAVGAAADPVDAAQAPRVSTGTPPHPAPDPPPAAATPDLSAGDLGTGGVANQNPGSDCPACGSTEMRHSVFGDRSSVPHHHKTFQIVECRNCRLIRLHPQPSPVELRDYYPPDYWFVPETSAADRLEQWYRRLVLRDHLRFVERALTRIGRTGTYSGRRLRRRTVSADARRTRPPESDRTRFFARCRERRLAPRGRAGGCATLSRRAFAHGSCAAVTMFHVLEHLYDPASYLDAAHQLLRPEGRLIVQVPNAACWQFLLLGERWNGIDVPRHLIDFRLSDVEALLERLRI